jgi:putative ABC transport system ATP-binding protein
VMDLLRRLNAEMNKTILMVTHDLAAAAKARRTLQLDKGALVERAGAA